MSTLLMRLRFAPSPTGALHIGGVRTALYNYLLARKHGGTFILRIEDTDQTRYVPGAEDYIIETLRWCGLLPDEGPGFGGEYGPYRQSERKDMYGKYAHQLVESGHAYYAFDTPEELTAWRERLKTEGIHTPRYDASTRKSMNNSLKLPQEETRNRIEGGVPYVVRLKVQPGKRGSFTDAVRDEVIFDTDELDDKVMLKADGMPTYHLANVVDDHLMRITHVVRGEEWLPSTPHHVLLYRAFGWEDTMPTFAHLPLILKPSGKGKLSKRDGQKLGIPVFPLAWEGNTPEESFTGFREAGYLPEAVINFLAFLGWNPGDERELFGLQELVEAFDLDRIVKSGARFDIEKATWFNQQHLIHSSNEELVDRVRPVIEAHGYTPTDAFLTHFCALYKERAETLPDFWEQGKYCFEAPTEYVEKPIRKRWKPERRAQFEELRDRLTELPEYTAERIESEVKAFIDGCDLKFGEVLPMLRLAVTGVMGGPSVFEVMALVGQAEVADRMSKGYDAFDKVKEG